MIRRNRLSLTAVIVCMVWILAPTGITFSLDADITPDELIQKHLGALGKTEKLETIKSRGISGKAGVEFIQGGTGKITDGYFLCVSDGPKVGLRMQFTDINYPGEYFAYDGREVTVGHITPGQKSPVAQFIFQHNSILKEGFLGGVMTTAWPLLHIGDGRPRMLLNKSTINGEEYYELAYGEPGKRAGEMTVKLYFDENFNHRRTEYKVRVAGDLTATRNIVSSGGGSLLDTPETPTGRPADSAPGDTVMQGLADSIYLLVETFDHFANVGGVALPQVYGLEYSVEGQAATFLAKWNARTEYFTNNGQVDQNFFIAQK